MDKKYYIEFLETEHHPRYTEITDKFISDLADDDIKRFNFFYTMGNYDFKKLAWYIEFLEEQIKK